MSHNISLSGADPCFFSTRWEGVQKTRGSGQRPGGTPGSKAFGSSWISKFLQGHIVYYAKCVLKIYVYMTYT
jgi:hypothetical protein